MKGANAANAHVSSQVTEDWLPKVTFADLVGRHKSAELVEPSTNIAACAPDRCGLYVGASTPGAVMSDAHSCYDKSLSQSLTRSSRSSASSCFDLHDQTSQHTADLCGSTSAAQPGTSSRSCNFEADMGKLPDDIKHIEHALHCEEEHFMSSPQNSDASAFSYVDAAFLSSPWSWSQQLVQPTAQVTAPTSPCLAEVPTEAIHETVNVACLGVHISSV